MTDHLAAVLEAVGRMAGRAITDATGIRGGDIGDAYRVELSDGQRLFVKTHRGSAPPRDFFAAEADGLRRLAETRTIRVPAVVGHDVSFLALEWIDAAASIDAERLGRELAALHRSGAPAFGLDRDNYVGAVAQDNTTADTWPAFYAQHRLEPLIRRNIDSGRLPASSGGDFDRLVARLDELCGPPEPPALLHGDLWGGNAIAASGGEPVLVDPAVYGGHREIDLAMMRLFGGFSARTFAAYAEAFPLQEGHTERVPLYQLYPLLVHVTLFGHGYAAAALGALANYR